MLATVERQRAPVTLVDITYISTQSGWLGITVHAFLHYNLENAVALDKKNYSLVNKWCLSFALIYIQYECMFIAVVMDIFQGLGIHFNKNRELVPKVKGFKTQTLSLDLYLFVCEIVAYVFLNIRISIIGLYLIVALL